MNTHVSGKEVYIKQTPVILFGAFSDLTRFADRLPDEYKGQITVTPDSIIANVKGMSIGVKVAERSPFSLVRITDDGNSPFPFEFSFHMIPVGLDGTLFHMELNAELNTMMKMMLGGKLQELVDKFTDQVEKVVSGGVPDASSLKPEDFS